METITRTQTNRNIKPVHCKPGTAIGRFVLGGRLGCGGMGSVFSAKSSAGFGDVAIKIGHSGDAVSALKNEMRVLSILRHPNIVRFITAGTTDDGKPYMVTEKVKGESLAVKLKGFRLSVQRTLSVAEQIASALDYLHSLGLVHRDVKPSNVMVTKDSENHWTVKLIDFGITSLERCNKMHGAGSLMYFSPEQLMNLSIDRRADIFQLALLVYECLTGSLPFDLTVASIVRYRVTGDLLPHELPFPAVNRQARMVLERALSRDPNERYSSATRFIRELRKAMQLQELAMIEGCAA